MVVREEEKAEQWKGSKNFKDALPNGVAKAGLHKKGIVKQRLRKKNA